MNERLPFEQLIGQKLQSLPVPDMQDAIWARVKAQLDIDLPSDDGDGGDAPPSPPGPGLIGWGLSVVIIALVTTLFLLQNKPQTKDTIDTNTTTEQFLPPAEQSTGPPQPSTNTKLKTTAPAPSGEAAVTPAVETDSVAQQDVGLVLPGAADSVHTNLPPPSVSFVPPKTDTLPPVKKGRGVKGLKDEDYRIVPKKDN